MKPQVMLIGPESSELTWQGMYVAYLIPKESGFFFIEESATGGSVKYVSPCHFAYLGRICAARREYSVDSTCH